MNQDWRDGAVPGEQDYGYRQGRDETPPAWNARPAYPREQAPLTPAGEQAPAAGWAGDILAGEDPAPWYAGSEPAYAENDDDRIPDPAIGPAGPDAEENGDGPLDDAILERRSIFKKREKAPPFAVAVAAHTLQLLAVVALLAAAAGLGTIAGIAKGYVETAPNLDTAAISEQNQTSYIYDANQNLITEYKGTENREMVSIAAMPIWLQHAFVAAEDARFYTHSGVDIKRIGGAFISNLSSSSTQGGSTITQQLIKNTLLSSEQSYKRKIQEAYLAMQLEQTYTKDQILETYMNTIWLGENYYGVQVAARGYFGKELRDLTLRECAMLAGMANSPYYYNPRRNYYTRHKEGVDYPRITDDRTDYVLRRMVDCGFISDAEYRAAMLRESARVLEEDPTGGTEMYQYPHFVEYAVTEVVDILLELEGLPDNAINRAKMENKFRTGGYRVQLTIDTDIQKAVEETLANWTSYPSLRDPSDKIYRASNGDGTYTEIAQPQAAAVVLDYRTGELKAIVGSRYVPKARKTLNRATDMRMPVGSSIKPLTVYAPALERGCSPASIVFNMPLPISGWKNAQSQDSWPNNYGGGGYTGPITLREAMKRSYNTAAAQTMMSIVGVSTAVDYLHRMGVDDRHIDATPFGVTLGSSGITPLQMTVAYGVLANSGVYQEPISVLGISDSRGDLIWDGHQRQDRRMVFSSSTAYMIVDMLKTVVSSGTGTSAKIKGQTVAGKTGTNSDQKGVTFAGMTGYYASCVWIGHDNYKALSSKTTGSQAAAPLWKAYMQKIHEGKSNRDIYEDDASRYGLVKVTTCAVSGQLATEACYQDDFGVVTDYWKNGTQPTVQCQMHTAERICLDSGMPASSYCVNVATRGVVTIPAGHPLYQFLGTKYENELRKYLTLSSGQYGQTCTLHTSIYVPPAEDQYPAEDDPPVTGAPSEPTVPVTPGGGSVSPGVTQALSQAAAMLQTLDPASAQAIEIQSAMSALQTLLANGYTGDQLTQALTRLIQAMTVIY
ncbi:MAG: PBP1A family penicillin-binding protein [Clostridia bacterium]|nr:PBP1A family penicillin-binding protein [Clostridia bacterium]